MEAAAKNETENLSLEQYRAKAYNVLVPSQTLRAYSDMHEPVLEQVFLSPNTEDGDVYLQEKGNQSKASKYAISKQGLMKLSSCAGIMWHPTETRRTDDRSDKNYVSYQAVGGVRKNDGSWVFWKGEYDIDFEVLEMEIREQYENKAAGYENDKDAAWWHKKSPEEKEGYVEYCIRRDLLQKRKHKLKLAESGAMNRVIRALLALKNNYTQKQLSQPFVVARVVFRPDYSDPNVRKQLTQASIEAMTSIYGPQRGAYRMGAPAGQEETIPSTAGSTIIDVGPEDPPEDLGPDPDPDPPPTGSIESQRLDFENADKATKVKTLEELCKRKAFVRDKSKKALTEYSDTGLMGFWEKLIAMPDKPADDDIPG